MNENEQKSAFEEAFDKYTGILKQIVIKCSETYNRNPKANGAALLGQASTGTYKLLKEIFGELKKINSRIDELEKKLISSKDKSAEEKNEAPSE